jgi:two-component system OmpR family response regulator
MSYKVALIDDDASLTELLSEFLVAEKFSVQVSNDGLKGFDSITSNKPDIVVLDIMMPHMNGIEVLKRIRSKSLLPVIILTAKGDDADCVLGLELGADDYVTKPCSPHALNTLLLRRKTLL